MKKLGLPLRIYCLATIFLLYSALQISHGLTTMRKANAVTNTTAKTHSMKKVVSPTLEYWPEFTRVINYAFIR